MKGLKEPNLAGRKAWAAVRRRQVLAALAAEGWNRSRAAKRLGYRNPESLFRAIRALGIKLPKGRAGRPKGEQPPKRAASSR